MKEFTEEELARYNGKNGNPVYVAYKGKVYDISASFLWKDGTHQVLHKAGADLTDALEQAPHSGDVLEKFPVVGILHNANVHLNHIRHQPKIVPRKEKATSDMHS